MRLRVSQDNRFGYGATSSSTGGPHDGSEYLRITGSNMGLVAWITGKIGGPERYGAAMGRCAPEHGNALGDSIFRSVGMGPQMASTQIFGTPAQMNAARFEPCFPGVSFPAPNSLTIYQRLLRWNLQTAMISFVLVAHSKIAANHMRAQNASKFLKGFQASLLVSSVESGFFAGMRAAQDEVSSYMHAVGPETTATLLNFDCPASGDLLEVFILRAVAQSTAKSPYGFVRTGPSGFDLGAVSFLRGGMQSIAETTDLYQW